MVWNHRCLIVSALLAFIGACSRTTFVATPSNCPADWRGRWSADSAVSLCLPPGFAPSNASGTWARHGGGRLGDRIIVSTVKWPDDWHETDPWPFHLASASNCLADCATVDSLTVHEDTIGGAPAWIETGLVTGGFSGFRRHPVLVASWSPSAQLRVLVYGFATRSATLDTIRAVAGTITLRARH